MSNQIRNFVFADKDAPVLWILTRTQLILMVVLGFFPWMWMFFNIKLGWSFVITIFACLLTIVGVGLWFFITSYKIDGRTMWQYYIDKKRVKINKKSDRYSIKPKDMDDLIDQIKK